MIESPPEQAISPVGSQSPTLYPNLHTQKICSMVSFLIKLINKRRNPLMNIPQHIVLDIESLKIEEEENPNFFFDEG
jgi:hypothetical protein